MRRRSRKPIDLRLKIAIIQARRTQRWLAVATRIGESRLSEIVGRRGTPPTKEERARVAKHLERLVEDLFDVDPIAEADADETLTAVEEQKAS